MTQPEALRLAAELEACPTINYKAHAAELRRLHAELERCKQVCAATAEAWREDSGNLRLHRDALLEALKYHQEQTRPIQKSIDAIAKAEGEKT